MNFTYLAGTLPNDAKDAAAMYSQVLAAIATFATVTVAVTALSGSKSLTLLTSILVKHEDEEVDVHVRIAVAAFHLITNGFHMFAFWLQCSSVVSFSSDVLEKKWKRKNPGKFECNDTLYRYAPVP